jgi:thiosulfate/3-mercaptopyruvate sulfurtransferase
MTDVLITAAELAELARAGNRPELLDVRWQLGGPPGLDEYRAGHIPGAVFVNLDSELAAPAGPDVGRHPLPSIEDLQAAARSWGLRNGEPVVVYDDNGNQAAARAWWLLRWAGLSDVRLLDGGLAAWRAAGLPLATGDETAAPGDVDLLVSAAGPAARSGSAGGLTIDADGAVELVEAGGLLLDARSAERFRGDIASIDPKPGHIPGAVSAPTGENLTDQGTFRPATELSARFEALGVKPGRSVGVYCGSGVTAAHEIAALAIAGIDDVVLYPGSYSQWATQPDRPVATGA